MKLKNCAILLLVLSLIPITSCTKNKEKKLNQIEYTQKQLKELLDTQNLDPKQRYTIIYQMATNLKDQEDYQGEILLLTEWVENNPDDIYNGYWLLMTAHAYLTTGAEPVAE